MASTTQIEWTDATWNPVTGCTKISAGCDNCYAERFSERFRGVPKHPFENGFDLQLRPERLDQPLHFEMSNARDVTDYYLFYATNELLGLKKMKEAMWKADESGEFRFSDATDPNQLVLFEKAPNFSLLQARLLADCSGKDISVGDIERFVLTETAFRETHYKGILKSMEKDTAQLKIIRAPEGRKVGTFGDPQIVVRLG